MINNLIQGLVFFECGIEATCTGVMEAVVTCLV